MKSPLIVILLFMYIMSPCVADDYKQETQLSTDIFQPSFLSPAQLKKILSPLYTDNIYFSADHRQLIFRAKQATINEIQSLLLQLDHPPRNFIVHLNNRKKNVKGINTHTTKNRNSYQQSFTIMENSTLTVVREHLGQHLGVLSPAWLRIDTVPIKKEYLVVEIQGANNHVYITVKQHTLKNGVFQLVNQQVNGPIGEWLILRAKKKSQE